MPEFTTQYAVSVENCDVADRAGLIQYRAKRDEWLSWYELRNDEPNSIQQQILSMIFVDLSYRILTVPRGSGSDGLMIAARSALLAHQLDQGYVANQILAIRRLLDKRPDVISVRRLLDDITEHRHLLTREVYVGYDGTPYDPDLWQSLPQTDEMNIWGIEAPGLQNYMRARTRHEAFDRLSGIPSSERERDDLLRDSVFEKLKQWLETSPAKKLILLSHKFFAHAADLDSRDSLEYSGILLTDIAEVQRTIVRVERVITDYLLFIGISRDVVPAEPLGFLNGLDKPYVSTDALQNMQAHWDQLVTERNAGPSGLSSDL